MILYLFGGYSTQNEESQWCLIEKELEVILTSQVLYLRFAHSGKSGALSFLIKEKLLKKEMVDWVCPIGIGIDEASAIKIDTRTFPEEFKVLGDGIVEVLKLHTA